MKFLVLSDMHGGYRNLDRLDNEFSESDAVLFAGDFARFQHPETGEPALDALCKKHDLIYSVIGNCDEPSFLEEIEKKDISIEGCIVYHDGLAFSGSGGGSKFTGTTPNERTDEELAGDLDIINGSASGGADASGHWNNLILIIHNPPKDTKCDQVAPGVHVGSPLLRKFIEEKQPLAVITGHIHEGISIDTIGPSVIINPGPFADGYYAVLEVEKKHEVWEVSRAELKKIS